MFNPGPAGSSSGQGSTETIIGNRSDNEQIISLSEHYRILEDARNSSYQLGRNSLQPELDDAISRAEVAAANANRYIDQLRSDLQCEREANSAGRHQAAGMAKANQLLEAQVGQLKTANETLENRAAPCLRGKG